MISLFFFNEPQWNSRFFFEINRQNEIFSATDWKNYFFWEHLWNSPTFPRPFYKICDIFTRSFSAQNRLKKFTILLHNCSMKIVIFFPRMMNEFDFLHWQIEENRYLFLKSLTKFTIFVHDFLKKKNSQFFSWPIDEVVLRNSIKKKNTWLPRKLKNIRGRSRFL